MVTFSFLDQIVLISEYLKVAESAKIDNYIQKKWRGFLKVVQEGPVWNKGNFFEHYLLK